MNIIYYILLVILILGLIVFTAIAILLALTLPVPYATLSIIGIVIICGSLINKIGKDFGIKK